MGNRKNSTIASKHRRLHQSRNQWGAKKMKGTYRTHLQRAYCVQQRDTGLWNAIVGAEMNAADAT